jgi:hypothetical protein
MTFSNKSLLGIKDAKSTPKLDIAVKLKDCLKGLNNSNLSIEMIKQKLDSICAFDVSDLKEIASYRDSEQNTILHHAVKTANFACIKLIVEKLGIHIARRLVTIVNNDGNTVFDIASELPNIVVQHQEMLGFIVDICSAASVAGIKPSSDLLDEKEILSKFPETEKNSVLHDVLKLAYKITNECRRDITASITHPILNTYSLEKKKHCRRQHYLFKDRFKNKYCKNSEYVAGIRESHTAVCQGYADIVSHDLGIAKSPHISNIEIAYFEGKGDHVVVVVNRKKGSDPRKPDTWGDTAFVIDAWAGKIFMGKDVFSECATYYWVASSEISFNLIANFNSVYHELVFEDRNSYHADSSYHYWFPSATDFSKEEIAECEAECVRMKALKKSSMFFTATAPLSVAPISVSLPSVAHRL